MKFIQNRITLIIVLILLPQCSLASDVVPFSIKRIKPIGAGYVELIGPSEIKIANKVLSFEGTKYVKIANIGTMSSVSGSDKGCVLSYSSEGYTENIVVRNQSCNEILSIFRAVK